MRRLNLLLSFLLIFFMSSLASTQILTFKHSLELEDAVGDIREDNDDIGKDVIKVTINSDGKNLHITAVLKEKISYYLEKCKAGPVITLHFDTDNDTTTGGKTVLGKKLGFEYEVGLMACIKYKDGGIACVGSIGAPIEGYASSFRTKKYKQGEKFPETIRWSTDAPHRDIEENVVETTFSYTEIAVTSGKSVRIAIREDDSTFDEKSFFPEVVLTLK